MKKAKTDRMRAAKCDMLPKFDFTGRKGVRGKYYRAYRRGHSVRAYEANGTVSVRHFTLGEGAVMLEPDVREYFPNSGAVNSALRSLIALIPGKPAKRKAMAKTSAV